MLREKAQVATEYLIVTGFILLIVTIVFGYAYVNYEQSVKVSQANSVLDSLVNKADHVYALGPENSQFVWMALPTGVQSIEIVHKCVDEGQGDETYCNSRGGIEFSAIKLTVGLVGGPATITRRAKAPLELVDFPTEAGRYRIRACWNKLLGSNMCPGCSDEKICLEKV